MRPRTLAAALALTIALAGCSGSDEPPQPDAQTVAATFLSAWSAGDLPRAGDQTTDAAAAQAMLTQVATDLKVTKVVAEPAQPTVTPSPRADGVERFIQPFEAKLTLSGLGNWPYGGSLPLVHRPEGWRVEWSPAVIHPRLAANAVLVRDTAAASEATVLDRAGKPLMAPRPVVTIIIQPDRLKDPAAAYTLLGKLGRTPANARKQVATAKPTDNLEQITVRKQVFAPFAREAERVGLLTKESERSLAETPDFARAVLDDIVDSESAAGTNGGAEIQVAARDAAAPDAPDTETLYRFKGAEAPTIRTTLDPRAQRAAEAALAGVKKKAAALVAIDASTGRVLAAANRDIAGPDRSFNRAFLGQYPPGSTFKVVTSAALLEDGLKVNDPVACPREAVVSGKKFQNVKKFQLGTVPFSTDFAQSCNTAFVNLAKDLPNAAIPSAAKTFGFARKGTAGAPIFTGSVTAFESDVDRVAAAIGQGKVLASPLAMATVAATVASGTYRAPVVRVDGAKQPTAEPLSKPVASPLKTLMQGVVTKGSARGALGGVPGNVGAKTGTAEFSNDGGGTHAWIIGFRDNLAFAVLIENGGAGGRDAGPVARKFLDRMPR